MSWQERTLALPDKGFQDFISASPRLSTDVGPEEHCEASAAEMFKKILKKKIEKNRASVARGGPPSPLLRAMLNLEREVVPAVLQFDRARNSSLHSRFRGGRCLIVGSSPSVLQLDLGSTTPDLALFLNKAHTLRGKISPSAKTGLVITDKLAYADYGHEIDTTAFDYLFLSSNIPHSWPAEKLYTVDLYKFPLMYDGFVQTDLRKPLYHGHSVMHAACQIALAIGSSEIVLAGIDLTFNPEAPHFYSSSSREKEWAQNISIKNRDKMIAALKFFAAHAGNRGVAVLNASQAPDSLPGIPKTDLSSALARI